MKYSIEELKLLISEYAKSIKDYDLMEEVYGKYGEIKTGFAMDFIMWLEDRDSD